MQRCLSQRDRTWGIRTAAVRNQLAPVKRVPASSVSGNENSEGAQRRSIIVGMRARCFPALGGSMTDSLSPMVADGGAVMELACSSEFRNCWSISLIFRNFTWFRSSDLAACAQMRKFDWRPRQRIRNSPKAVLPERLPSSAYSRQASCGRHSNSRFISPRPTQLAPALPDRSRIFGVTTGEDLAGQPCPACNVSALWPHWFHRMATSESDAHQIS
jgi:hypothetical protein